MICNTSPSEGRTWAVLITFLQLLSIASHNLTHHFPIHRHYLLVTRASENPAFVHAPIFSTIFNDTSSAFDVIWCHKFIICSFHRTPWKISHCMILSYLISFCGHIDCQSTILINNLFYLTLPRVPSSTCAHWYGSILQSNF